MVGRPVEEPMLTTSAPEPVAEVSLARRVLKPRTLASFVIAAGVILFALSRFNLDLGDVLEQMRGANPWYLLGAFAVYYGSFTFRAIRWRSLLGSADVRPEPGRHLPTLGGFYVIYLLSWFVNCLVPAKLGDAYRGYALRQRSGASFSAALGTIFAERLADLVGLGVLLLASGFLVFGRHIPKSISDWLYVGVGLGMLLVVAVLVAYRIRHHLRALVPHRFRETYIRLEEGALGSFSRLPTLIGLTAVIWLFEGLRFFLVGLSLHAGVSIGAALLVALLVSLLTAVPITPAGLGIVELGTVGTLALLHVGQNTAASMAFLDRIVAYWSVLLIGGVVYLAARWRWR